MSRPLRVSLVPESLWGKSLAHVLPNWSAVRNKVCACGCCAVCDTKTTELHAHEVWHYDDDKHIVDLADIIPVCENCHMALHFGKANVDGKTKEALAWYCQVNGIAKDIAKHEIRQAFETWEMRNRYPWIFKDGISRRIEEITGIPCSFGASSNGRVYLKVPFSEKDEAKSLGAKWDVEKKLWYIYGNLTESPAFSKWRISEDVTAMLNNAEYRSR